VRRSRLATGVSPNFNNCCCDPVFVGLNELCMKPLAPDGSIN